MFETTAGLLTMKKSLKLKMSNFNALLISASAPIIITALLGSMRAAWALSLEGDRSLGAFDDAPQPLSTSFGDEDDSTTGYLHHTDEQIHPDFFANHNGHLNEGEYLQSNVSYRRNP